MFHLSPISHNKKTGPIAVTVSEERTCPDVCPFKVKGCYAKSGPLLLHWNKVNSGMRGMEWKDFLAALKHLPRGQMVRHNAAGDLPGDRNKIDTVRLSELTAALKNKRGFTYTHKPVLDEQSEEAGINREAVKLANEHGFTVNLSGNNLAHADKLVALGIAPVVSIVPSSQLTNCLSPAGNRVVICPATVRDNVTCSRCGLCARAKRDYIIAFPAHGNAKRTVSEIAGGAS